MERVVETISSAMPLATLQRMLAVAGATTTASIFIDSWICSSPAFGVFGKSSVGRAVARDLHFTDEIDDHEKE